MLNAFHSFRINLPVAATYVYLQLFAKYSEITEVMVFSPSVEDKESRTSFSAN